MSGAPLPLDAHRHDLAALAARGRLRSLIARSGRDFASNDYLALAGAPRIAAAVRDAVDRGVPAGAGGSRLLRGNHEEHVALEAQAARHFGTESALYFGSGFAANAALLATLPQRGDLIVHDALVHASALDGIRMARAPAVAVMHNDAHAVDDAIASWRGAGRKGTPWIAIESLYGMDGDRAPLDDLALVAARHDAMLLIDEAHATGVFGAEGGGLAGSLHGRANVVALHTCGKAMGCEGALVCGPRVVTDFLINRARGFIFSTAPSPLMAVAVSTALDIVRDEPERRDALALLIDHAGGLLGSLGAVATGSQIVPLIIGDDIRTMAVAARLQAAGFDVRGIRPPTVPPGTSRLRISLTLNVGVADIEALGGALAEALA